MYLHCKEIAVLSPLNPHVYHCLRLPLTPLRVLLCAYFKLCLVEGLSGGCGLPECEDVTLELEAEAVVQDDFGLQEMVEMGRFGVGEGLMVGGEVEECEGEAERGEARGGRVVLEGEREGVRGAGVEAEDEGGRGGQILSRLAMQAGWCEGAGEGEGKRLCLRGQEELRHH